MTAGLFLAALRHDRTVALSSLAFVVLLAWTYLLLGAGVGMEILHMGGGQMMAMPPEWTLGYGLVIFVMWAVMMVAMMLPNAAPVTLLIDSVARKRAAAGSAARATTALFVFGYLGLVRLSPLRRPRCNGRLTKPIAFRDDGLRQCHPRWHRAGRRWGLSMDAFEGGVPATLPLAARLSSVPLA